jgi:hypothetical protein
MQLIPPSATAKGPGDWFTGDIAGDTVWTPPGDERWHGVGVDCMMCHIAMLEGVEDGDGTTWLEPVTDEQYAEANRL